jgi:hypothetical protein
MPLSAEDTAAAAIHMKEALGDILSVALLTCDDLPATQAQIVEGVNHFPAEMRDALNAAQRTDMAKQNVKQARVHLRALARILDTIDTPDE